MSLDQATHAVLAAIQSMERKLMDRMLSMEGRLTAVERSVQRTPIAPEVRVFSEASDEASERSEMNSSEPESEHGGNSGAQVCSFFFLYVNGLVLISFEQDKNASTLESSDPGSVVTRPEPSPQPANIEGCTSGSNGPRLESATPVTSPSQVLISTNSYNTFLFD